MTIEQLVKELSMPIYKKDDDKIRFLKKHLKTDYLDYELKMTISKGILDQCRYTDVVGRKVYSPNGPVEYECKIIALIQSYYKDIELRDGEDRLVDFNLLEKHDISKYMIAAIGEDIKRFDAVYGMIREDIEYKESFVPWLDTKIQMMGMIINRGMDLLDNPAVKEKINEMVSTNNE